MPTPTTLYEELGGQQAIEQVVDDFYKRVLADKNGSNLMASMSQFLM